MSDCCLTPNEHKILFPVISWVTRTGIITWEGVMVFNATFNNISVMSCRSVLLVEETRALRENHRPATSQWQTLSHKVISTTSLLSGIRTITRDDDNDVRFVLNQHTWLDFYSASSLKQQSSVRHIAPFEHIILIPSKQVFARIP